MYQKITNAMLFITSFTCLIISLMLFHNQGYFIDEHALSAPDFYGGNFLLILDWLRLGFLAMLSVLSGIKLFKNA